MTRPHNFQIIATGAWFVGGFVTGYASIQMAVEKILEASKAKSEEVEVPSMDGNSNDRSQEEKVKIYYKMLSIQK